MTKVNLFQDAFEGKSIAVIGNARSLLKKEHGELIDSHDIVVRFNDTIMTESASMGKKTDIFACSGGCKSIDRLRNKPGCASTYLKNRFSSDDIVVLSLNSNSDKKLNRFWKDPRFFSISIHKQACTKILGSKSSAGFIFLYYLYACSNPKSVSIFGFDWKKTASNYHKPTDKRKSSHNWALEASVISKFISEKEWNIV